MITLSSVPELITIDELAELCRVPRRSVESWNTARTGPAPIRLGKFTRYHRADVQAWLTARRENGIGPRHDDEGQA